ncbi:methylated-DNA--[protein]-cysteine S-methyltransferase [Paenibacillus tarimensis]
MESSATLMQWTRLEHADWNLHIAATMKGICFIGGRNRPLAELENWARKHFTSSVLVRDDVRLQPFSQAAFLFLEGKRRDLDVPMDLKGTPFQLAVWQTVYEIPYGQTRSYSAIAAALSRPKAVRAVAAAIAANPVLISIPCHRVIGKNGALTGYRGGLEMKGRLLKLEREHSCLKT